MKFDPDQCTYGEIIALEEKAGMDIVDIIQAKPTPTRALAAIVWVLRRRDEPSLTWEDALKLPLSTANELWDDDDDGDEAEPGMNGEVDPTEAAASVETVST